MRKLFNYSNQQPSTHLLPGPIPGKWHTASVGRGGNRPVCQEDAVLCHIAQGHGLLGLEGGGGRLAIGRDVEAAETAGGVANVGVGHAAEQQADGVDALVAVKACRALDQPRHAVLAHRVGGARAGSHCTVNISKSFLSEE